MDADRTSRNSRQNLAELVSYINSKSNPTQFLGSLLSICKPRGNHLSDRNQESQISVRKVLPRANEPPIY